MKSFLMVFSFLISGIAYPQSGYVQNAINDAAKEIGVPARLLEGICWKETKLDVSGFNFSDGGGKDHAVGMCQVLISTAADRSIPKKYRVNDERCHQDFRGRKSERIWEYCKLFGPRTNARVAAYILKQKLERYEGDYEKAIAAYNTGTILTCRDGWLRYKGKKWKRCLIGEYANQYYVDGVVTYLTKKYGNRNKIIQDIIGGNK